MWILVIDDEWSPPLFVFNQTLWTFHWERFMNQRIQNCFLAKTLGSCCWASLKPSWRHSFEFSELAVCICVFVFCICKFNSGSRRGSWNHRGGTPYIAGTWSILQSASYERIKDPVPSFHKMNLSRIIGVESFRQWVLSFWSAGAGNLQPGNRHLPE